MHTSLELWQWSGPYIYGQSPEGLFSPIFWLLTDERMEWEREMASQPTEFGYYDILYIYITQEFH